MCHLFMEKGEVSFKNKILLLLTRKMDGGFVLYVAAQMFCFKGSHFFSTFPAIKLGKTNGAFRQKRNDAFKHTVNATNRIYIIVLFHVLQFCYNCIPGVEPW